MSPFRIENRKGYSDQDVISAFCDGASPKKNGVLSWWYSQCKRQFSMLAAKFDGLPAYHREDIFQDSIIILWRKAESHQLRFEEETLMLTTKNGVISIKSLMGYFVGICKNKFLELSRVTTLQIPMDGFDFVDEQESACHLYWDEDPEIEKTNLIMRCISELPKSCMDILRKFYYEKMSLDQILAERKENLSYDGLKTRKSKCLSNLKRKISGRVNELRY